LVGLDVEAMNWISVEVRLPDIGSAVLAFGSEFWQTPYRILKYTKDSERHRTLIRRDGQWWDSGHRITHWMPLPDPPVADSDAPRVSRPKKCPTCDSPDPKLHPSMQPDGGEVQICRNSWHEAEPVEESAPRKTSHRTWTEVKAEMDAKEPVEESAPRADLLLGQTCPTCDSDWRNARLRVSDKPGQKWCKDVWHKGEKP
jgi:hypothetical protein